LKLEPESTHNLKPQTSNLKPQTTISETDLILNEDGSVYHLNLLPDHISDTIITVGDPDRVASVSQYFDSIEFKIVRREFVTHGGSLNGKRLTVISTGMGTDNVEIFFTELDALVNINLSSRLPKGEKKKLNIIRIGTSGSLQEDVPLDSHLVSGYAVGLDNLMHFYDLPQEVFEKRIAQDIQHKIDIPFTPYVVKGSEILKGQIGTNMIPGNTVTTPGFYAPQGRTVRLPIKYPTLMQGLSGYYNTTADFRLTNFEMETAGYYALGKMLGHEVLSVNAIIANRIKNKFSKNPGQVVDSLIRKVLERV
jgi:uridine phosphorylase